MKKRTRSTLFPVYYFLSFLLIELSFKVATQQTFIIKEVFLTVLFTTSIALGFYVLCRIIPEKGQFISFFILYIFMAVIYSSQLIYYQIFKTYYSFYSARNASQVVEFWRETVNVIGTNWYWLILFFLPAILLIIFKKYIFTPHKIKVFQSITLVSIACLFYLGAILTIHMGENGQNSAYSLYYYERYQNLAVQKFGLLTAMRQDVQRTWTDWSPPALAVSEYPVFAELPEDEEQKEPVAEETNEEEASAEEKALTETETEPIYEDQILSIDFENLIANETNEEIKAMHQYFSSVPPTKTNEYTGKYEGYNLIFITAEAFSPFALHKEVTPTLYKLVHEGFHFTNFYTPVWEVSTSDGEYVATTGLIPKSGVWSFEQSSQIKLPFVMGNQLKKLGYKTVAYHNHTFDYYRRDLSHPNMGYDYKGVGNGLEIKKTWPESDLEMMEVTIPEYINDEPFHAYYMTVSGHLLYNFTGNYIAYKNRELVEHLPYSEQAKAYLATQIELDRALEHLLEKLEEACIADRTLIALSADHYPYGLDKETMDEFAGHTIEENFELYKNLFILYTKDMEPTVIDKPASSLDIIPTLSNLLGLDYDSRLLMGQDIFSDASPLVIFLNRSFITDKGSYNAVTKEFIPHEGAQVDEEYVERMKTIVDSKFYYSAKILDLDYYSHLNLD